MLRRGAHLQEDGAGPHAGQGAGGLGKGETQDGPYMGEGRGGVKIEWETKSPLKPRGKYLLLYNYATFDNKLMQGLTTYYYFLRGGF